jgi:hypothetical protein
VSIIPARLILFAQTPHSVSTNPPVLLPAIAGVCRGLEAMSEPAWTPQECQASAAHSQGKASADAVV